MQLLLLEMDTKLVYYIYKTTNTINGKLYIGSHKATSLNFDGYFGSGKGIRNAILKYGECCFTREILEIILYTDTTISQKQWTTMIYPIESRWIKYFIDCGYSLYNRNFSAWGGSTTHNTIWINNNKTSMMIDKSSNIPKGYVVGRIPSHVKCTNKGKKLYTNIKTNNESFLYDHEVNSDWILGSAKQNRQLENNQAYGKRWYQNIETKEYTYCCPTSKPNNFEAGHPDWKYDKNWKTHGWVRV